MNKNILNPDVQNFINSNWDSDILRILLKKPLFKGIKNRELVEQLESKKKSKNKLPTWFNTSCIYYPNKLNIEQTSSEITAKYKAQIIQGNSLLDITGGLGVDSFFFAKNFKSVIHCEMNSELSKIGAHNFELLGAENIQSISEDGITYLKSTKDKFDIIYVDPSRRDNEKRKVFLLSDCSPNVPKHLDIIFKRSDKILIKTSPLIDISVGMQELQFVKEIHIVAVENEVKELLWLMERGFNNDVTIKTINLKKREQQTFEFKLSQEKTSVSKFSYPLQYLYEPNRAILKSGAFKLVGDKFSINKLHEHSHLYTSDELVTFPGRTFKIFNVVEYNKKAITSLGLEKANITTRNFPESVVSIRKYLKIKDGGLDYLFFTKNLDDKSIVIHSRKIVG